MLSWSAAPPKVSSGTTVSLTPPPCVRHWPRHPHTRVCWTSQKLELCVVKEAGQRFSRLRCASFFLLLTSAPGCIIGTAISSARGYTLLMDPPGQVFLSCVHWPFNHVAVTWYSYAAYYRPPMSQVPWPPLVAFSRSFDNGEYLILLMCLMSSVSLKMSFGSR